MVTRKPVKRVAKRNGFEANAAREQTARKGYGKAVSASHKIDHQKQEKIFTAAVIDMAKSEAHGEEVHRNAKKAEYYGKKAQASLKKIGVEIDEVKFAVKQLSGHSACCKQGRRR